MKSFADLVHSGVVGPSLAVKFRVSRSLFLGYSPVISSGFTRRNRLSWHPGRSRGGACLGSASPLASVIDSVKVKGERSGCAVLKGHLGLDIVRRWV